MVDVNFFTMLIFSFCMMTETLAQPFLKQDKIAVVYKVLPAVLKYRLEEGAPSLQANYSKLCFMHKKYHCLG
jgi:hypothetical protein